MAHQDQPETESSKDFALSGRIERYKSEVEKVVREIGEHPLYELKRSCSLKVLKDRIEFIKDIQSVATSHIETEKFVVIGADSASRSFVSVENLEEFDEATIRQILEKYLSPIPQFELFQMNSSDGNSFVLFVVPKQKSRRILAKVTVEDQAEMKPRVLLREGDLWTKGTSTGKRLAKAEDWDEIYEETIESETETRTRQRTAHALDLVAAREKVSASGIPSLPSHFTDDEFQALMENLCSAQDQTKFNVLLERLRDDLVEGWHELPAYEQSPAVLSSPAASIPGIQLKIREHIENVFRPAMHWLTLAGIYTIKNSGPVAFLDGVSNLLKEVFDTSNQLVMLRSLTAHGTSTQDTNEHLSHTVPALESLVALHLMGAYLAKRGRYPFMRSLLRANVYKAGSTGTEQEKTLMAFWPFGFGWGEPDELRYCAGRITYCVKRIVADTAYAHAFGSKRAAISALCQYELCLEFNSYLAVPSDDTRETADYVAKTYPAMYFHFWPSLIAFPLEYINDVALLLFTEIKNRKPDHLRSILFDIGLCNFLVKPDSYLLFARFLSGLAQEQSQLYLQQHRFPPTRFWPKEIEAAINEAKRNQQQAAGS
jgi:hypothetical protein